MTSRRLRLRATFLLAAGLLSGAALIGATGVAGAHDFGGGGDCDSWTVHLDGTYGAHTILIDGVAQSSVKTDYVISDGSDDESRTFTVKWDKSRDDVTKTHTLKRDTDGCTPPTTESPPTTTVPPTTTTTVPDGPPPTLVPPTVIERPRPAVPTIAPPQFTG